MRAKIRVNKILYPKNCTNLVGGQWAIISAKTVEVLEGEQPKINKWGSFSVKGNMCDLKVGDIIDVSLNKEEENQYGFTYNVESINLNLENLTDDKLVDFLLEITTDTNIKNQLRNMPNLAENIRNKNIEELSKINGLGEKKIEKMYEKIEKKINYHAAITELNKYNFTERMIEKICDSYNSPQEALKVIKTNPYGLIDAVDGIGFVKADEIAKRMGTKNDSEYRIKAAIKHVLIENGELGKSYISVFDFMNEIVKLLNIDYEIIKPVLINMRKNKELFLTSKGTKISLYDYAKLEHEISLSLLERVNSPLSINKPLNWMEEIEKIQIAQGWEYTNEQLEAIEMVLENNISAITGLAGTGKTTIVDAMKKILKGKKTGTCALSAKAAQRIEEVTGEESYTIHRLLGTRHMSLKKSLKNRESVKKGIKLEDLENNNNTKKPYTKFDIIVLDEASMVNGSIFLDMLNHIPLSTKIIILGDPGQLTAIGNCSILADLITSNKIPSKNLNKIHRQAQKSAMITESINVRMQNKIYDKDFRGRKIMGELEDLELHVYDDQDTINKTIIDNFFRDLKDCDYNLLDVQIILPARNRGINCCKNINNKIQDFLIKDKDMGLEINKDTKIFVGDKVINTANNYNAKTENGVDSIFNGNIGIVKDIDFADEKVKIEFNKKIFIFDFNEAKYLNLAYAITIHSSQGSAWKKTIVAFDNSAYIMLNCEIVYTGMTRAYNYCTLIVEHKAMEKAIKTQEQKSKATFLVQFLEKNGSETPLNI